MKNLPHQYQVRAVAAAEGDVSLESNGLLTFKSAAPAEFGGPGDRWSPETLLVAAIADCFILTFRAIATAMKLDWQTLHCDVNGTLAHAAGKTRFTEFTVQVRLHLPVGSDDERARVLLQKAKDGCFIANSLSASIRFEMTTHLPADA